MSHDKIKTATRERMTRTGEPYTAARREVTREHRAASPGGKVLLWINGPCGVGKTATAAG
jgi:flagellar biosynthesis GTPase FlhF